MWRSIMGKKEDKKKILIVDDEAGFCHLVKLNLERAGAYEVQTECEGSKALAAARAFKPDLIYLDVLMPGVSGPEVAAQLKKDKETSGIPIVFLTAAARKGEVDSGGGVIGGYPFLAKPVETEELIRCIKEHLA